MKYIGQFTIILGISFLGEFLHYLIDLPIPSSIYGIAILFILLETRILPLSAVRETARYLIEIMPIMFIPAAAGVILVWDIIKPSLFAYALVTIISTIIVMVATGLISQYIVNRLKNKPKERRNS